MCTRKMDDTLKVKQEPHSDDEVDLLSLQDQVFSVNIKKEPEGPVSSACLKTSRETQETVVAKIAVSHPLSVQSGVGCLNMKEEEGEYPTPLACVEVKYEITETVDSSSSLEWNQSTDFPSNMEMSKNDTKILKTQKCGGSAHSSEKRGVVQNKRHTCNVCGKEYKMLCHLKSHTLIHTGEKPYLCSVCGKSFRLSTNLKMHSLIHTGEKPHVCERCGKAFAKRADLKQHFLTHTTEMPHKCSLCGKGFRHALSLKVHTRTHTGEKPYTCNMCARRFLTPSHLKTHTLTHTGEKPYVCTYCGKGFFTNKDLKRHHPIHSRDKPYVCSVCGKGFCQKSQLEPHMLKKHRIETTHICKVCGLSFNGIQALRKHSHSHSK